ncbi:hypothetical protein BKA66DRAFT_573057 [Pyrenochaeta sp. MPI-SDFR-AT-0127]|nr:hypothetical protein BKA66DRAFT_573057 [Pyrenochaeta sp. MPI-SDFR-AT-0127]
MAAAFRSTLSRVEEVVTKILRLPLATVLYILPAEARVRKWLNDARQTPPRVRTRKRRLTLPLDDAPTFSSRMGLGAKQETKHQTQSPLLQLPAEIRLYIWAYVVDLGQKEELRMSRKGYAMFPYKGSPNAAYSSVGALRKKDVVEWGLGVMGLLCSCRTVYTEIVPLLYLTPTFHFTDVYAFFGFSCTILPHRRAQIRYLKLDFLNPGHVSSCSSKYLDYEPVSHLKAIAPLPKPAADGKQHTVVSLQWAVEEILKKGGGSHV